MLVTENLYFNDGLTINADDLPEAPAGKRVILTVNGTNTKIAAGKYDGNVELQLVKEIPYAGRVALTIPYLKEKNKMTRHEHDYRAAVVVDRHEDGTTFLDMESSALSAVSDAQYGNEGISGGKICSRDDAFNGVLVLDGDYRINGTRFDFVGNGGDDFEYFGAAIAAGGASKVVIDNVDIRTKGVIASALNVGEKADVLIQHSHIVTEGTDNSDYFPGTMSEAPWVLGIKGTLRATNLVDDATVTFYNTTVEANGWGVFSTDDALSCHHNIINSVGVIASDAKFRSGYGAYVLSGAKSRFLGVKFDVPTYGICFAASTDHIIVGPSSRENLVKHVGENSLLAQETNGFDDVEEKNSEIISDRFAFHWHGAAFEDLGTPEAAVPQKAKTLTIEPGTRVIAGDTVFLIKAEGKEMPDGKKLFGIHPSVEVKGASIISKRGIILHYAESDDAGMGKFGHDKTWAEYYEQPYVEPQLDPENDITDHKAEGTMHAVFEDMDIEGDFYNTHWKTSQNIWLEFKNTNLHGVVSSGTQYNRYVPEGERIYPNECYLLGQFGIKTSPAVNCGVIVHLGENSRWILSDVSYLTALKIEAGAVLVGENGMDIRMTVNGVEMLPVPGEYKGMIKLSLSQRMEE